MGSLVVVRVHLHSNSESQARLMDVRSARTDLAHDVESPRMARRFVTSVLSAWGVAAESLERAQLLVSELVSNSVLHGGGPISVSVEELERGTIVRVEVANRGHGEPRMRHPSPEDLSGRGLQLVDELSRGWGSSRTGEETKVWFEVPAGASA